MYRHYKNEYRFSLDTVYTYIKKEVHRQITDKLIYMATSSEQYVHHHDDHSMLLDLELDNINERQNKIRDDQYNEFIQAAGSISWHDRFLGLCQCLPEDYFHAKRYARELLMSFPSMRRHTLVVHVNGSKKFVNEILGSSYHARRRWKLAFNIIRAGFELRYRARLAKTIIGKSGYLHYYKNEPLQSRPIIEAKFEKFGKNKSFKMQQTELNKYKSNQNRILKIQNFWVWGIYISCLIYIITLPLDLSFGIYDANQVIAFVKFINFVIDLLWIVDLFKYLIFSCNNNNNSNKYISNNGNMMKDEYRKTRIIIDLYCAFPWYRIIDVDLILGVAKLWSFSGMVSLLRILKISSCKFNHENYGATTIIRWKADIFKYILVSFAFVHFYACLFFDFTISDGIATYMFENSHHFVTSYQNSFYHSFIIITGSPLIANHFPSSSSSSELQLNIYNNNNLKPLLFIGSMFHFLALICSIAYGTNLFISMTSSSQELNKRRNELEAYMEYRQIPIKTKNILRECYSLKWNNQRYFDEESVLKNLTAHTRKQVLKYTNSTALLNLPFLRNTCERFRKKLVYRMHEHVGCLTFNVLFLVTI